jgi:hypothetical protein
MVALVRGDGAITTITTIRKVTIYHLENVAGRIPGSSHWYKIRLAIQMSALYYDWFHDDFQTNVARLMGESCECCLVPAAVSAAVVALEMAALAFVSSIVRHEAIAVAAAEVMIVFMAYFMYVVPSTLRSNAILCGSAL